MADLLNFECPCCCGKLQFNSEVQKMQCPYCDSEFEMQSLMAYEAEVSQDVPDEMTWDTQAGSEWQEGEQAGMNSYSCQSCGGEIVTDASTAASFCPYCDSPVIMTGQVSGELRPDFVIPFKLDKEAAKKALTNHMKGKKLLPDAFLDQNHIDEIKGLYVPVWLFDADVDARIRYKAQKTRYWEDARYRYTETSFYSLTRGGKIGFHHVPVDGSTKMDDKLMEAIEPFDFKDAVSFQSAFLSGYLADKYDVDANASIARANERIKHSTEDAFKETTSEFESVMTEQSSIQLSNGEAKYALYPVWILTTKWNDQKFTFAMNGQTGKFVGDLPTDKSKAVKSFAGFGSVVAAVAFAIEFLLWFL